MTKRKPPPRADEKSSKEAVRVPGGWKLPGDDTVYPYNPHVPPDMVDPVPRPRDGPDRTREADDAPWRAD